MRTRATGFRFIAIVTGAVLFLAETVPGPARAQTVSNPGMDRSTGQPGREAGLDPPARVGRLARVSGTVSFHTADQDHWEPASLNYPITSGNALWTEPGAAAELDIANSRIALAEQTELDIDTLDDHALALTTRQGEAYLNLRDLPDGDSVTVRTPRGMVTIERAGRYGFTSGDTERPTTVTVIDGRARISGDAAALTVGPGETATLAGTDSFTGVVGRDAADPFLRARLAAEAPPPRPADAVVPPADVARMTGGEALGTIGDWSSEPSYGPVWYPPVDPGWVPYRDGHWAYVAPWGWTWVDDEPWGFAPFHYGRWVEIGSRWGWIPVEPGYAAGVPPIYAPALISWVNVAAGAALGLGIGAAVGWIPLGPRERFEPWYRCSPGYIRDMNRHYATTVANIGRFANRGAATVVPRAALAASLPIASRAHANPAAFLAGARTAAAPPVRPTLATAGVTPAVARQLRLARPPAGAAPRPTAPGPVLQAHAIGAAPILHRPAGQASGTEFGRGPGGVNAGDSPAGMAVPGGTGRGGAVSGAAILGGAAALGGAALLHRGGSSSAPGRAGLPPLVAPRATGSGGGAAPGLAPGPPIQTHITPQGGAIVPPGTSSLPGRGPGSVVQPGGPHPFGTPGGNGPSPLPGTAETRPGLPAAAAPRPNLLQTQPPRPAEPAAIARPAEPAGAPLHPSSIPAPMTAPQPRFQPRFQAPPQNFQVPRVQVPSAPRPVFQAPAPPQRSFQPPAQPRVQAPSAPRPQFHPAPVSRPSPPPQPARRSCPPGRPNC